MRTSRSAQPTYRTVGRQAAAILCCLTLLTGCQSVTDGVADFYDSKLSLDNPVDWWHQLQGGPIAAERPPPPGITDPYPNLSRVPPKPVPTDAATRAGLTAQLATQRDRARVLAAQDPITFPAATPGKSPAAPASTQAAAPQADADASKVTLDAANGTSPATPAAPTPPPANEQAAPAAFTNPPRSPSPIVSGPIPPLPTAAPPLPILPGLPTAEPAPVVARARPATQFSFAPGSSILPDTAEGALRALAARRAGGPVSITAGGDARSADPDVQGAALPLALRRTGAMAAVLIAAGVPSASIRVQAVAPGREASARLVD